MSGNGNEEYPRVPRSRLQKAWNGVKGTVEPRLTIILTIMVAVVMVGQAVTFIWALNVGRHTQESHTAEMTAILNQLHHVALENESEGQSHRCRNEQLWREQFRRSGRTPPPYPPGIDPPKLCDLDEGHP